jgi:hypothetical protein
VRFGTGHAADQVQNLGRLDAIELGAKLERVEWIEEGAAIDLAVHAGQRGVKQAKRDALGAQ